MSRPLGKKALLPHDLPQSLLLKTRALIKQGGLTLEQLSAASGVPYYWLKKFSAGEIPNPAVNRVQYLYEFMSATKLIVE